VIIGQCLELGRELKNNIFGVVKMRKAVFSLLLIFSAGIVFGQATVPAVVVTTFSSRGQAITADDAESITELFIAELAKRSEVRVVDRASLDRVIAEMRFQNSDWSNPQKTAQLGAALNADILVRGQLNQLGEQVSVALTALDIKTLEVVSSSTQSIDINRLYNNEKSWGSYRYTNIFGTMESMAYSISQDIDKRQNWFVGRWRSTRANMVCILELKPDGTIIVERYDYKYSLDNISPRREGSGSARGTGTYHITEGIKYGNTTGTYSGQSWRLNISLTGITDTRNFSNVIEYNSGSRWKDASKNAFEFGNMVSSDRTYSGVDWYAGGSSNFWDTWNSGGLPCSISVDRYERSSTIYYYEFFRIQ
jgi:TolB-like protein